MRINKAKNDKELYQMLKEPLREATKILMNRILEENYDCILRVVYNAPGRPLIPAYYESTTEFLDAWDVAVHDSKAIRNVDIQGSFFYKPSEIKTVTPPYDESSPCYGMGQHHGLGGDFGDSRQYLAELIYEGISGKAYGEGYWTRKRNAFEELVKIVGKRNMKNWMAEAMRQVGLKIQVHGTPIQRTGWTYGHD